MLFVRLGGLAPARPMIKYGNYYGGLIGKALNGLHSNVLLGQITISKTRSKRVNENIAIKSQYMQIFMFVSVSVSIVCTDNDQ